MMDLTGRCFCGDLRYHIVGGVRAAFYCHCEDCRRSAGAPFVAWGRVEDKQFAITTGEVETFNSSPKVVRCRCARCGTEICYRNEDAAPDVDFLLATLDEPDRVRPTCHVQIAEKLAWVELHDSLPKFERWKSKG